MTDPRRLFDCIAVQLDRNPEHVMLAGKEAGKYKNYTTTAVAETVNQIAAALLREGISGNDMTTEGRDKVALLSKNRPEWIMEIGRAHV